MIKFTPDINFPAFANLYTSNSSPLAFEHLAIRKLLEKKEDQIESILGKQFNPALQSVLEIAKQIVGDENNKSIFDSKIVISSNPYVLTGTAADSAQTGSYVVSVDRLASSQHIVSNTLTAGQQTSLATRTYNFRINYDADKSADFSVKIYQTDTNKEVLKKIKNAINSTDVGLAARIKTNTTANTVKLEIRGIAESDIDSVTVVDTSGKMLETLGISSKRLATGNNGGIETLNDGVYFSINGKRFESSTNTISLFSDTLSLTYRKVDSEDSKIFDKTTYSFQDKGYFVDTDEFDTDPDSIYFTDEIPPKTTNVEYFGQYQQDITVEGASQNAITLKIEPNVSKMARGIEKFFSELNTFFDVIANRSVSSYVNIKSYISNNIKSVSEDLEKAGITQTAGGTFEVNKDVLKAALTEDLPKIKSIFDSAGGLGDAVLLGIQKLIYDPISGISPLNSQNRSVNLNFGNLIDKLG